MKRVYLAGVMEEFHNDNRTTEWRIDATNQLNAINDNLGKKAFIVFNPTLSMDYRHDIISQNSYYIRQSDILLVNLSGLECSFGTINEMAIAFQNNKPIITFGNCKWDNHPYMNKIVSAKMDTLDECISLINNIYIQ